MNHLIYSDPFRINKWVFISPKNIKVLLYTNHTIQVSCLISSPHRKEADTEVKREFPPVLIS